MLIFQREIKEGWRNKRTDSCLLCLPRRQTFDLISMQTYARSREGVRSEVVGDLRQERRKLFLPFSQPSTSTAFCALQPCISPAYFHSQTSLCLGWLEDTARRVRPNIHKLRHGKVEKAGHKALLHCFFFSCDEGTAVVKRALFTGCVPLHCLRQRCIQSRTQMILRLTKTIGRIPHSS